MKRVALTLLAVLLASAPLGAGGLSADEGKVLIVPGKSAVGSDLRRLEKQADAGDAEAAYRIGQIEERGIGRPADTGKAIQAYLRAAELGHRRAALRLGQLYSRAGDYAEARLWYGKAAQRGNAVAAFNLGLLQEGGLGGPVALQDAIGHYELAVSAGVGEAALRLAELYRSGRAGDLDRVRALAWYMVAERLGTEEAAVLAEEFAATMAAEQRAQAAELASLL